MEALWHPAQQGSLALIYPAESGTCRKWESFITDITFTDCLVFLVILPKHLQLFLGMKLDPGK